MITFHNFFKQLNIQVQQKYNNKHSIKELDVKTEVREVLSKVSHIHLGHICKGNRLLSQLSIVAYYH